MVATATAIYEKGTLRLLTPVSLPERTRVRVQIQEEDKIGDEVQRAAALLEAAGLVKPAGQPGARLFVSQSRRSELAQIYAAAGPLSESIGAEREELASALAVNRLLTDANLASPIFVCADKGLLAAAEAAGMPVDNPNLHP